MTPISNFYYLYLKAIQSNPLAGEAWKRRGQARAALGESAEVSAVYPIS